MEEENQADLQSVSYFGKRQPYIDWIRVFAVILLVPFHAALIFDPADPSTIVYVKKQAQDISLVIFQNFLNIWQMPLLFVLAGMSVWYALGKRSPREFIVERCRRLGVPLVFGILVLIPPMIYLYLLEVKQNPPSFLTFYIGFFASDPGDLSGYNGGFTPAHLWFILYLFIFSLVLVYFFTRARYEKPGEYGEKRFKPLKEVAAFVLFLPGIVLVATSALPAIGGKNPFFYCTLFIFGFTIASDYITQDIIMRIVPYALFFGVVTFLAGELIFSATFPPWSIGWVFQGINFNMGRWFWTIAIIGLGRKYIKKDSEVLRYVSNAAYPFYILHFLMLSIVGYFVIQLPISSTIMYTIIVPTTIFLTFVVYELFVRRNKIGRFLFGMKNAK